MCGICGKLRLGDGFDPSDRRVVREMTGALRHRGPDDEGIYESGPVALGHRRLSIIDLTTGRQPLSNEDDSVWVVFNGEIYNYRDLALGLVAKGHRFKTATDTEVIVHLYEELGEHLVAKLQGMFSFALWDEKRRTFLLARDRVGIKPLYYHLSPQAIVFASEIKALLQDPAVPVEVEPAVLDRFLTFYYTPGEETLFRGTKKLLPGHYLLIRNGRVKVSQYWDVRFPKVPVRRRVEDCVETLSELLRETVRSHMISDVPVGVLLSGGVDSTAMLSFAVECADKDVSTFTIGFDESQCVDERPYARLAAERFGTRHFEATICAEEFLECLPKYVWHMEEPVCEPPGIALYYITKLARSHVKVLISGEGGDEAFGGYQNYRNLFWLETLKEVLGPLSGPASFATSLLGEIGPLRRLKKYAPLWTTPFENYYFSRSSGPFDYLNAHKVALYTRDFLDCLPKNDHAHSAREIVSKSRGLDWLSRMLYVDTKTWLPDDLLIKADKMAMANAVELRVPLLDHHVLEFAASLPRDFKLRRHITKYILKKALSRRIPKPILERKKTGFPVPYASWIKNDLKGAFREIVTDQRTIERGYFQRSFLENLFEESSKGRDFSREIFSLAVLELWHRRFVDGDRSAFLQPSVRIPQQHP